jgi:ArsR family transcriptional regulator
MRNTVKVYKALSDESRLRVLNLLFERECCVCEIEQVLGVSQSKASRILSTLYEAGLLILRKEGLWSLYSIDWEGMDEKLKGILRAAKAEFEGNEQMAADKELLKVTVRTGAACAGTFCEKAMTETTGAR